MKFRHAGRASFMLGLLLCMTFMPLQGLAFAQSTNGSLAVTVKDSTGALVPGATIRVVNEGTPNWK